MRISISLPGVSGSGEEGGQGDTTPRGMDVLDAAYHTAHGFPGGVLALAQRMGVNGNTLMQKVSVNNNTHHLTLKEAMAMQEITGNVSILMSMAATLGYDVTRTLPANTTDLPALHWQMVLAFGELLEQLAHAMQEGVSRNAVRRIDGKAADLQAHINNMLAAVRDRVPTPPKVDY